MKKLIKKSLKILSLWALLTFWCIIPSSNDANAQIRNTVPDYYYANYKFVDSWDKMWEVFWTIKSRQDLWMDISSTYFSELNWYFQDSFPHLTQDYKTTYEKCELLAKTLESWVTDENLNAFLWNSCYRPLNQAVWNINQSYTIRPQAIANPTAWSAPIRVTFDARWSVDPSSETIPTDNFFWYYRDENWVDTPMWIWNVINYEFKEAWKFIVHLVVRSSNVNKWILDWEEDLTINVSPKAANIVVYANTRKMSQNEPVKIWTTEWVNWVVFDWSATRPTGWRKIESHTRSIVNQTAGFSYRKQNDGAPSYTEQIYLEYNWEYKVTLTTKDNENNEVSETFSLYVSDPVSVIRQAPAKWTTSTTYTFDGSASYSLSSRLTTYLWEIFNEEWNKTASEQWKSMTQKFKIPWNYLVRLIVTDLNGRTNEEIKDIYVESTPPTPQFTITPTSKRAKPSEFTLDASNSTDIDVTNWVDKLEYEWSFSNENVNIISTEDNNRKIVVQFNNVGEHIITLKVTDKYWKSNTASQKIKVDSILRPNIIAIPWAIAWWKVMKFNATVNEPVISYRWSFWDWLEPRYGDSLVDLEHIYKERWVYSVNLEVSTKDWDTNSVTEKVFIWEIDYPIAAYKIKDNKWFFIQSTETCKISWIDENKEVEAYPIDRYEKFTIDPSISVNTQWNSNWLKYVYELEWVMWENKARNGVKELTHSLNFTGCHFVDLTIQDPNVWKQDKTRIRFYVKNAKPKIKNVSISFPQYQDDGQNSIWLNTSSGKTTFDCSWTSNVTVKVSAEWAEDSDGSISRYRFYYYNVDDPNRILEFKEASLWVPYAYFVVPRVAWEYKFWVMIYDNDGDMVDSKDYLWSSPSVYFPSACDSSDIPTVTLQVSNQYIEVWDTVTYKVIARIPSDNENFEVERTIYYDFTWDGSWDLTTKKDTATFTFLETYENGFQPRVAVEYRNKIWMASWALITVRNWIKPILLYTSYKNIVLFRDISLWELIQRRVCFERNECDNWNKKFMKSNNYIMKSDWVFDKKDNPIFKNDMFIQRYPNYWNHEVSIELKDKYWMSAQTWFIVKTSESTANNGRIAPGVNILTIPETTFNNNNPEIFLPKIMNDTLLMYVNYEWEWSCYVDIDISSDSDKDWHTDNDVDAACNTVAKLKYTPNYESVIWKVIFTDNGKQVSQNFYVTFEWFILELSDEYREIYNNITTLINWIDDRIWENANLKSSLDVLRKNLNNRILVSSTVMTIRSIQAEWGISLDTKQKDLLSDILSSLDNEDTIDTVWLNAYEKNREEILAILPYSSKSVIRDMFKNFEDKIETLDKETKAAELKNIRNRIGEIWQNGEIDNTDMSLIDQAFCNVFEYYDITSYTKTCGTEIDSQIQKNMEKAASDSSSNKKWLPTWLIVMLVILFGWVLVMWGIIAFFSLKSRLKKWDEDEEW